MDIKELKKQAYELFQQEKTLEAQKAFNKLCLLDETDMELWLTAGITDGMLGDLDSAIKRFQQVIKLEPKHIDAIMNVGFAYEHLQKFEEAIACYQKAVSYYPQEAGIHFRLGTVLDSYGKYQQALSSYKQAIKLDSNYIEVYFNMGLTYLNLSSPSEALECYTKYKERTDNSMVNMSLGTTCSVLNKYDEALNYFKKAFELDSSNLSAQNYYADLLSKQGYIDEAISIYRAVLSSESNNIMALTELLQLVKNNKKKEIADKLELALNDNLIDKDRITIFFILGEFYDGMKLYEQAFEYFSQGNAMIRNNLSYNSQRVEKEFNLIASIFTGEFIKRKQTSVDHDILPIFVLGMPRSGTTLVEQIMSTHHDVEGAGEVNSIKKVWSTYFNADVYSEYYPEKIVDLDNKIFHEMAQAYIADIKKYVSSQKRYIINKMPHNFMFIGLIKIMFPNAKIILCERNAIDTCWSIYKKNFQGSHEYSYSATELAKYYLLYESLMEHWKSVLDNSELHVVNYEKLTSNPEKEIRALTEYCGLGWQDALLNFHTTNRLNKTASKFQVRQKMYTSSIGAWKPYKQLLEPLLTVLEEKEI